MPLYRYEASDEYGKRVTGLLEASGPAALRDLIVKRGCHLSGFQIEAAASAPVQEHTPTVVRSSNAASAQTAAASTQVTSPPSKRSLSSRSEGILLRQLAGALRAGITLFQAVDALLVGQQTRSAADLLTFVRSRVQAGSSLADALEEAPVRLRPSSPEMIRAGERAGALPEVLDELAFACEREHDYVSRVAPYKIMYLYVVVPAVVVIWPIGGLIEGSANANLGAPASAAGTLHSALGAYAAGLLHQSLPLTAALLLLWFGFRHFRSTSSGQAIVDAVSLSVPFWGNMQRGISIGRFLRVMGYLYKSGVSPPDAWSLAARSIPNRSMRDRLLARSDLVQSSSPLSVAFSATGLFSEPDVSMLSTGEQSGSIDEVLFRLASYEDQKLERSFALLPRMMQALLLLSVSPLVCATIYHVFKVYVSTIMRWSES